MRKTSPHSGSATTSLSNSVCCVVVWLKCCESCLIARLCVVWCSLLSQIGEHEAEREHALLMGTQHTHTWPMHQAHNSRPLTLIHGVFVVQRVWRAASTMCTRWSPSVSTSTAARPPTHLDRTGLPIARRCMLPVCEHKHTPYKDTYTRTRRRRRSHSHCEIPVRVRRRHPPA